MGIKLYSVSDSPPTLAVRMALKYLGLEYEIVNIDYANGEQALSEAFLQGEQFNPDYLKKNPAHCVPTLDDKGFLLGERGAIMKYLVNTHSPGHTLYPDDIKVQAKIDWMLLFDVGTLYPSMREFLYPHLFFGKPKSEEAEKNFREKLSVLEAFLGDKTYLVGDSLTLADLSLLGSINLTEMSDFDMSEYKKLLKWREHIKKELPKYEVINDEGNRLMADDILGLNPGYAQYNHLWGK